MLDQLPEEIMVIIISGYLDPRKLEETLSILPCVCSPWSRIFHERLFWIFLGKSQHVRIRSRCRNPKEFFWKRRQQLQKAKEAEADDIIVKLSRRLARTECAPYIRKQLLSVTEEIRQIILHRAVPSLEQRTLLHMAAWHGRHRAVYLLLQEFKTSFFVNDDNNATPLLIAAWAGHIKVVAVLLSCLAKHGSSDKRITYIKQIGVPPQSSSCGGKGPKAALEWARRKGFTNVVRLLERALSKMENKT
jgi:hypothetical protein